MRLIDADKLESIDFSECVDSMEIMAIIDTQPTVYDVDKVVEELDKSRITAGGFKLELIPCDNAIEIVKRGGINDN